MVFWSTYLYTPNIDETGTLRDPSRQEFKYEFVRPPKFILLKQGMFAGRLLFTKFNLRESDKKFQAD